MTRDLRYLRRHLSYLDERPQKRKETERNTEETFKSLQSDGWSRLGGYTFNRIIQMTDPLEANRGSGGLIPGGSGYEDLLFFDTETTGLSGGAGNLIFLMGMARITGAAVECEQIFLTDFPGESEFLEFMLQRLKKRRIFVSFNGKSFDSHILKTRFLLNGMHFELEQQIDLLYWARRLWRRSLSDCSLANIEREILGIHRVHDISGFEVPGIYFNYLRTGHTEQLPAVMKHNLQDVLSLVKLFSLVDRIITAEKIPEQTDLSALGSYLLDQQDLRGLQILKNSFAEGDQLSGKIMSLFHKREEQWAEAVGFWKEMVHRGKSLFACLELAKYYEHRRKDPKEALFWVQKIVTWNLPLDIRTRRELAKRRERLEKKLRKSAEIRLDNN